MQLDPSLLNKAMDSGILLDTMSFIQVVDISDEAAVNAQINEIRQQKAVVIFTSASAVYAVCEHPDFVKPDWQLFCIEKATKKAVLEYFDESDIKGSAKDSDELAAIIKKAEGVLEVVFFCGDKRMDTLPTSLLESGIITKEVVVYKTVEQPQFVEKEYDGILFYSPSGVSSFFSLNEPATETVLFAIGNTTAQALKIESTNPVVVCDTPSKEILLYKAISHFKENN